jgi:3'(2'), 5'-bisphosphate nucleotidase
MPELPTNYQIALKAAIEAGISTLKYFKNEFAIQQKHDSSPLTQADLESNALIEKKLLPLGIPIISEESATIDFETREKWKTYWLVDPLDGTKEFIAGSPEYTINIALIENNYPIFGVVYLPVEDILYYGDNKNGAYKKTEAAKTLSSDTWILSNEIKLPILQDYTKTVIVASKTHNNKETTVVIQKLQLQFKNAEIETYGSSLKLCMIAEGRADIYPRLGPTMEWDIAAAHAVLEASGNKLVHYPSFENLTYNKKQLINPWFIAYNCKKEKAVKEIFSLP